MKHLIILGLSLSYILTASPIHAITGQEVVEKVHTKFEKLSTLSARFEKTFEWKLAKEVHKSKGKLYIKKPDRFRIETESWVMCSDGVSVWTYSEANEQVLISDASESKEALTPQAFLFQYTEGYQAEYEREEKVGKRTCYVVKLTPKEQATFVTEMTVWVNKKNGLTQKVTYTDINGNVTIYQLSLVQIDKQLDDALFRFDAPEGIEVIDMRE